MDKLLELLSKNSRLTTSQIAVMLNKTENEVSKQIEDFEKQGIIKGYHTLINWDKTLDAMTSAIIELKVAPKKDTGFDEIARKISSYDEVEGVYLMAGVFDLAVVVRGKNIKDIAMFVSKKLSTMESVISTATHFIMSKYKEGGTILADDEGGEKRSIIF